MTRDRHIDIEDLRQAIEEEEDANPLLSDYDDVEDDPEDIRVDTFGECWLNPARICSRTCMAFNVVRVEEGEHACLMVQGMQQLSEPILAQKDEGHKVIQKLHRSVDDFTRMGNGVVQALNQLISRIR